MSLTIALVLLGDRMRSLKKAVTTARFMVPIGTSSAVVPLTCIFDYRASHIEHPIKEYRASDTLIGKTDHQTSPLSEEEEESACDMRGMLSFMILWLLSKRPMYGQELAAEIGKRRGEKPNPGTIYPALKDLASRGMIRAHLEG